MNDYLGGIKLYLDDVLYYGINYAFGKFIKPDLVFESVTEITADEVDILINRYGIRGIILDVDGTLRFNMGDIPEENSKWLDMITSKLKVIVVSNGIDKKMKTTLQSKGIEYIGFAHKPLKRSFLMSANMLDLAPSQIAVIGDDIISDIYGGRRNKMFTIKITKPFNS